MDAASNKDITPSTWGKILDNYVDSRQQTASQGRLYVYVTPDMQYKLLSKGEASRFEGLSKLSLKKIIDITLPMLRKPGGMVLFDQLEVLGNWLAAKKVKPLQGAAQVSVSNVQKKVFSQASAIARLAEPVKPQGPRGHNLLSPERLQQLTNCLAANPAVSRSGDGRDGVFYLEHPEHPKMVLKFCVDVHKHILADRLVGKFFSTPGYESLSSDMQEAKAAVSLVSEKGRAYLQEHLDAAKKMSAQQNVNLDSQIVTLGIRIKDLDWVIDQGLLTATFLDATAFKDIMASDRADLMSNQKFLHQIGQMMLVDTFLNNTDRISENVCNKANFMIRNSSGNEQELVCIDHDFNITHDNISTINDNLTNLLGEGSNGLELRFNHLTKEGNGQLPCDKSQVMGDLKQGIEDAAKRLVKILKEDTRLFDLPAIEGCISADPSAITKITRHLEMLLNQRGN